MRILSFGLVALATACAAPRREALVEPRPPELLTPAAEPLEVARSLQSAFREVAHRAEPAIVTVRAYVKNGSAPAKNSCTIQIEARSRT